MRTEAFAVAPEGFDYVDLQFTLIRLAEDRESRGQKEEQYFFMQSCAAS